MFRMTRLFIIRSNYYFIYLTMCGIFAYHGSKNNAGQIAIEGLKRLDYRGYDSWGVAVCNDNEVTVVKKAGKISDIQNLQLPASTIAIAHTRWATTGKVTT